MRRNRLALVPSIDEDGTHAVVETEDHEVIDFDASSRAELEAKLHDFLAWAS